MAKKAGGNGGGSSRGIFEVMALLAMLGVVGLELHLVFHAWWPVWPVWLQKNPVTPLLLVMGLLMGPLAAFIKIKGSGKQVGEDAEQIIRGIHN